MGGGDGIRWTSLWKLFSPSLLLLSSLFLSQSGKALIRNNRVILHDEHLPTAGGHNDSEEEAGDRERRRRALPDWREEWRKRAASSFGMGEDEMTRVRLLMARVKEELGKEERGRPRQDGTLAVSGGVGTKSEPRPDGLDRELRTWTERRVSDQSGASARGKEGSDWPEERSLHFQGDIVLSADQAEVLLRTVQSTKRTRAKRKFIGSLVRRWEARKPILYSFDGSHTLREQRVIELALEHWHNITCLDFERRNDEPRGSRIVFTDVDGCASNVGRHPLGEPQFVSLAPECIRLGVIAHEVAHALGFWHEQSRPDRDLWVRVQWENIDRDSKGQFLKEQPADVDAAGVPYDYGSIMHYRSKAFARYDDLFTIGTFIADYQRTIGQRDQLSFNDIRLMNQVYCRDVCPRQLVCQRGGYTDPRHCERCRCPDGFTGTLCELVMPGYGAECGGRLVLDGEWAQLASPNYPAEFREGQECSWLLVAPAGQRIQLQFHGEFEMYCKVRHSLCMDYVEVRNGTDFANTGMRYCCYGTPTGNIHSATRDMLVLFRSFYRGGKGFQARARAVPTGGGKWTEWDGWTECSASCGGCGLRRRSRKCMAEDGRRKMTAALCQGVDTETEACGRQPCPGLCARQPVVEEGECQGVLGLLKGVRCRSEKRPSREGQQQQCPVCCAGFRLDPSSGLCSATSSSPPAPQPN